MIRLASFFNVKRLGTGDNTTQILQQTNTTPFTHLCSKALAGFVCRHTHTVLTKDHQ